MGRRTKLWLRINPRLALPETWVRGAFARLGSHVLLRKARRTKPSQRSGARLRACA